MTPITSRQRAILKSLAHSLSPVAQVGKDGVNESVVKNVTASLNNRELLKVKVLETAPASAQEMGEALAASIEGAELVQVIGRVVVLYRRHPEKPEITLPGV